MMIPSPQPEERRVIVTITKPGLGLARKLKDSLGADLYVSERYADPDDPGILPFDGVVKNLLPDLFTRYDGIVLIMALGIVVRTIAPLIQDKKYDPGIVVTDVSGKFAISLLSGHLGGANQLAREVADVLGAIPVITTGTDVTGTIAPDLMAKEIEADLVPFELLKRVSSAIVDGDKVLILNPERIPIPSLSGTLKPNILSHEDWPDPLPAARAAVLISTRIEPRTTTLPVHVIIRPRTLTVGLGCNRGTSRKEIQTLLEDTFIQYGLSPDSILRFATIDLKSDEEGILETVRGMDRPLVTFTKEELSAVEIPNPSRMVESHVGTPGVAEPAALLALRKNPPFSGGEIRLLVPKTKSENATLSVAEWIPTPSDSVPPTDSTT